MRRLSADLPPAAGLSSSSALIVAFTLCLLRRQRPQSVLRGIDGGVCRKANTSWERAAAAWTMRRRWPRAPVSPRWLASSRAAVRYVAVPDDWAFLVAHSLQTAEKSGAAREAYNRIRGAGKPRWPNTAPTFRPKSAPPTIT